MKNKVVIYGFDGVLVDSKEAETLYYKELFDTFNVKNIDWSSNEEIESLLAMTKKNAIKHYAQNLSDEELKKMLYFIPKNQEEIDKKIKLKENVKTVLNSLSENCHLAICTNRDNIIYHYLSSLELENYFEFVISADEVKEPKPSPEGLNLILNYFSLSPSKTNAFFVGDNIVDYMAGESAGISFFSYQNPSVCDKVLSSHEDILTQCFF